MIKRSERELNEEFEENGVLLKVVEKFEDDNGNVHVITEEVRQ